MSVITILRYTPVWVWSLLAVLVVLGLAQTRYRELTLTRAFIVPLVLVVLSLTGVLGTFGHLPVALGGWAAGIGAVLTFARQAVRVRGATWSDRTRRLQLPGSWLPLCLFVGLFAIKYAVGVSVALNPSLATDSTFAGVCSLVYGGFSGLFLGRALYLRALAARSPASRTARA